MSMLGNLNKTEPEALVRARLVIYMTLGTLSFLLNFLFLIALAKSWKEVKQRRISYHIANLASSDAVVGSSTLLHFVFGESEAGNIFVLITWTAILTSLLAISLMAFERALAIRFPHRWSQILPLKVVFGVMVFNWCGTLLLAVLMHFYNLLMRFILLVLFYIFIAITTIMYSYIYYKMVKIKNVRKSLNAINHVQIHDRSGSTYQRKVGNFVMLLTTVLVVTVSPAFITQAVKNACEAFDLQCAFLPTLTQCSYYFYMLEITNFAVNPIIYVWRMQMYRRAVRQLFCWSTKPYKDRKISVISNGSDKYLEGSP